MMGDDARPLGVSGGLTPAGGQEGPGGESRRCRGTTESASALSFVPGWGGGVKPRWCPRLSPSSAPLPTGEQLARSLCGSRSSPRPPCGSGVQAGPGPHLAGASAGVGPWPAFLDASISSAQGLSDPAGVGAVLQTSWGPRCSVLPSTNPKLPFP